jgi:phage terminase large subunit-like protein
VKQAKRKRGRPLVEPRLRKLTRMREQTFKKEPPPLPQRLAFPPKPKGMTEGKYRAFKFRYFCETYLHHGAGAWFGKPFILEPWERKISDAIFGTLKEDGTRQYRKLLIHIGRRNGKSTLAAAFIIFWISEESFSDPAAEVYGCSADEKQALLIFKTCQSMVRQSPELTQLLIVKPYYHTISNPLTNSVYEVLTSKVPTKPGRNSSLVIMDETWALPSSEMWSVMENSMGSREQPLMMSLSTAGESSGSFYYELYEYAKRVEQDPSSDPAYHSAIFETSPDDDPFDERVWKKANPGLGIYRSLDEMRELGNRAKQFPASEGSFRRHCLNQWVSVGAESWMQSVVWNACSDPIDVKALPQRRCFIGLDLAATTDLAAMILLFEPISPEKIWDVIPFFWVPGSDLVLKARTDHLAYDAWAHQGLIYFEGREAIDLDSIQAKILELDGKYQITAIGFDPWRSKEFIDALSKRGFEDRLIPIPQQPSFMSDAITQVQHKVAVRELRHSGNPVLKAMSENTKLAIDIKGNKMLDKKRSITRIDGISALCIGLAVAVKFKIDDLRSVYEDRGILYLEPYGDEAPIEIDGEVSRPVQVKPGQCSRCGEQIGSAEFCPNCGARMMGVRAS